MITKIYAFNAQRHTRPFAANNLTTKAKVSFGNNNIQNNESKKPENALQDAIKTMPNNVSLMHSSSIEMLQRLRPFCKKALAANIAAQNSAEKARGKAETEFLLYIKEHDMPENSSVKIENKNKDGTKDIIYFQNGVLSAYHKNIRKKGSKIHTDEIFIFENEKLKSYKANLTTTYSENKGKDAECSKSIEYEGISMVYKEGCKKPAEGAEKTEALVCLILGKPWYFEEGITDDKRNGVKKVKRKIEFSNEEKTTYSYLEDSTFCNGMKLSKQALYVEDEIPYRYCEEEEFFPYNLGFNSYNFRRILYFSNGKWRYDTKY